jgi:integrase
MAKSKSLPSYRKQKARPYDRAFVELDGQRVYLGRYDLPTTREKYRRLLSEWLAGGLRKPDADHSITIVELIAIFWRHVETYYRKPDGTPTTMQDGFRMALKPLKSLYGSIYASKFGPLQLKAVRQEMMGLRWSRTTVNRMVGSIRLMFRWAVAEGLIPVEVHTALATVDGLRKGRTEILERELVHPAPETHVNAVEPYVSRQVWALIQLQLHTAARPGELIILRAIDIDTSGNVWTYTPADHKTAHHGHRRTIYIGPRGQDIIREFMSGRPVDAYLFNPKEAIAERHARAGTHRRPNQKLNPKRTKRTVRSRYDVGGYRRAIERACLKAGVPIWTPHQLRHNAATFIRREYGLEAAQIMLGHSKADVTQLYAEISQEKAVKIAEKIG